MTENKRELVVIGVGHQIDRIPLTGPPGLTQLQKLVDGFIELIYVDFEGEERPAYVNEEGRPMERQKGKPLNAAASHLFGRTIYGPLVIEIGHLPEDDL